MRSSTELRELFNNYLVNYSFAGKPQNLYDPITYIMKLGGKRIRPILVMMGCELFGGNPEDALQAGLSLEVFHNFTLVHDDIMDAAETRRGAPTVHKKYNQNIAILAGDAMLIKSYQLLGEYQDMSLKSKLFEVFTEVAGQLCSGQQMDMNFETTDNVDVEDYIEMIVLKTGVLIAGALKMGALIGGASNEESNKLYGFGKNIGIAFQLQDDLLDTFGTFEKVGKKIGGDIVQNKKTYLYLKAIELADDKSKEELKNIYLNRGSLSDSEKISTVTKLFESLVVDEYARQVRDAYLDLSYAHLASINIVEERKIQLKNLGQQLVNREY